jgi:hypothetical protein
MSRHEHDLSIISYVIRFPFIYLDDDDIHYDE